MLNFVGVFCEKTRWFRWNIVEIEMKCWYYETWSLQEWFSNVYMEKPGWYTAYLRNGGRIVVIRLRARSPVAPGSYPDETGGWRTKECCRNLPRRNHLFMTWHTSLKQAEATCSFDVEFPNQEIEEKTLKRNIKCYYYKELRFFNNRFSHFLDFNPFFIVKFIKILKKHKIDLIHIESPFGINVINYLTKIPTSYSSHLTN